MQIQSLDQARDTFRRAIEFVNRIVVNRSAVIDQIFCALLTREHALIQSRTGAAKSLLAQQIFAMFDGAHTFMVQASKEQQPDTYFGGLDIEELKKGRIIHNTQGSLVESEFGFIDEIFDANDYTLRALLTTLNERALVLGVQYVPARVHSVIAATNYLRVSEITEALLDRFVYKSLIIPAKVPHVQIRIARQYLDHGGKPVSPPSRIPYGWLSDISRIVKGEDPPQAIRVPMEVVFFANAVVRHYEMLRNRLLKERPQDHPHQKDVYISPRTYAKGIDMLRASAFLHGRNEVTTDDVSRLWYLHTTVGMNDQRDQFMKSYETVLQQYGAARAFEQIRKMLDFQEILDQLRSQPDLLKKPITEIDSHPARRTLKEWVRETLGMSDPSVESNRRILEAYVRSVVPSTEEIQELRLQQERDVAELFQPASRVWS